MGDIKHEPLSDLDHPFNDVFDEVQALLKETPQAEVYFKFTCENCLSRQTFDVPNVLYKLGECEECGHITNVEKRGCNFTLIVTKGGKSERDSNGA